jgi:HK97 family phage portal protein
VSDAFSRSQKRAIGDGKLTTSWASIWNSQFLNVNKAGVDVNWDTALKLSTFYACVRNISEDIAKLPVNLYQEFYDSNIGTTKKYSRNQEKAAFLVRKKPNEINSGFDLVSFLIASAAMNGNGYAYIKRDKGYNPIALYPIWSNDVIPMYVSDGTMMYKVNKTMMRPFEIPDEVAGEDMIHIKGLSLDGCTGVSVIRYAVESLASGLAATTLANSTFQNGAAVGGVLSFPQEMSDDAYQRVKNSWESAYGGVEKSGKTAIIEGGATFQKVTMSPEDAQLLESREFNVVDICRWFRMPPHKVQHLKNATFSNIEHQSIEYVQDCLMPWGAKIENEFERKLLTTAQLPSWYYSIDYSEILRGDSQSQAEYVSKLVTNGIFTPNEGRKYMFQNPIDGGDVTLVPLNLLPIDKIDSYYNKDTQPKS